jgi:hypothetical protein
MKTKPTKTLTLTIEKWKEEYLIIINKNLQIYCKDFDTMRDNVMIQLMRRIKY